MRLVAGRLFELGRPTAEIAHATGRRPQTVRAWRRAWRKDPATLRARTHPGRTPRLSPEQWQAVLVQLARSPQDHGYDAYLWTTTLMARMIKEKFDVDYHHDYVGEMLHKLGWSCQRPTKRSQERDEQAIALWQQETWPTLLKKVATTGA